MLMLSLFVGGGRGETAAGQGLVVVFKGFPAFLVWLNGWLLLGGGEWLTRTRTPTLTLTRTPTHTHTHTTRIRTLTRMHTHTTHTLTRTPHVYAH